MMKKKKKHGESEQKRGDYKPVIKTKIEIKPRTKKQRQGTTRERSTINSKERVHEAKSTKTRIRNAEQQNVQDDRYGDQEH